MIGRENIGSINPSYYFNGNIDEVRFSREAVYVGSGYVFANGIEQAWGHLGTLPSTTGLWKFDNQDGRDASANGDHNNQGTLQGSPLPVFASDVPKWSGHCMDEYLAAKEFCLFGINLGYPETSRCLVG